MKINDQIKLKEDCKSRNMAIRIATEHIAENGYDLKDTYGYIYIVGPGVSDLLLLKPCVHMRTNGKTKPRLRACTDQEWGEYFYTFVCSPENREEKRKRKKEETKKTE